MAVTVFLKNGVQVCVDRAIKVKVGRFIGDRGVGGPPVAASVVLEDPGGTGVGEFLHDQVMGYFIHGPSMPSLSAGADREP